MATIPTKAPDASDSSDDFIKSSQVITLNDTISAVNKNEPVFGVGTTKLCGYVSLKMYDQHQASIISNSDDEDTKDTVLFNGKSYASGKPYTTIDKVWADGNGTLPTQEND